MCIYSGMCGICSTVSGGWFFRLMYYGMYLYTKYSELIYIPEGVLRIDI